MQEATFEVVDKEGYVLARVTSPIDPSRGFWLKWMEKYLQGQVDDMILKIDGEDCKGVLPRVRVDLVFKD